MAEKLTYQLQFEANKSQIMDILKSVQSGVVSVDAAVNDLGSTFTEQFDDINDTIKTVSFSSILDQVDRVVNGLGQIAQPGMQFSSTLAEVSAITGVTGAALDDLSDRARASALEFGGNAADSLNIYKTILSRLGPDIAAAPEALSEMEHHVRTLSKTMGGDTEAAVSSLTTALLQFGVDLSDPIQAAAEMDRMMNVMAASSQKGAVEIPGVAEALIGSGTAMKQANVTFEEGNSMIQALTPKMKGASEAGTALRGILQKMAGEDIIPPAAIDKLTQLGVNYSVVADKSIPLTDRLKELKKANGDATIWTQVFGEANAAAASILIDSIEAQEEMTRVITDTNTAYEMADVIMKSPAERAERIKARIEELKLTIFDATGGHLLYVEALSETGRMMTNLAPLAGMFSSAVSTLTNEKKRNALWSGIMAKGIAAKSIVVKSATIMSGFFTTAVKELNLAMKANPVLLLVSGVAALSGLVYGATQIFNSNSKEVEINNEVHKRAASRAADETAELNIMIERLKNTTAGTDTRRVAMQALMDKYPDYLKGMNLEKASMDEINKLHIDIADNIMKRAEAEVRAEMYKEKVRERMDAEMSGTTWGDEFQVGFTIKNGKLAWESAEDIKQKRIADLKEEESVLLQSIENAEKTSKGLFQGMWDGVKEGFDEWDALKNNAMGSWNPFGGSSLNPVMNSILAPTVMPGTINNNEVTNKETSKISKTNSSIATGGQRTVNNTFNIKSLVESLSISGKDFKENAGKMQDEITDTLIRSLAMASATAG